MTALAAQLLQQLANLGRQSGAVESSGAVANDNAAVSKALTNSCRDAASQVSQAINTVASATGSHCSTVQDAHRQVQAGLQQALLAAGCTQGSSTSHSSALQQLLHLVVEGPHQPQQAAAAAGTSRCAEQRDGWPNLSSLQLLQPQQRLLAAQQVLTQLDVTSLGKLPGDALGHALLLKPSLLPHLLSEMACTAAEAWSGGTPLPHQSVAAASTGIPTSYSSSSSSSSRSLLYVAPWTAVTNRFPGARHLPVVLAHQPHLLLLARSTLHSWLVSSNHPAVALLLTQLCRPAWQQLLLEVRPPAATHQEAVNTAPAAGAAAAAAAAVTTGTVTPAAGCMHHGVVACCPAGLLPLLQLLVTAPTPEGLGRLVGLLQQLQLLEPMDAHEHVEGQVDLRATRDQQEGCLEGSDRPVTAAAGAGGGGGGEGGSSAEVPDPWDLPWPSDMDLEAPPDHPSTGAPLLAGADHQAPAAPGFGAAGAVGAAGEQGWRAASSQLVESAWQLLLEHRCWYEAALWLLVRTALEAAAVSGAPAAAAAAAPTPAAGAWETDASTMASTPSTTPAGSSVPPAGEQAARVIAWVQEPHDSARQQQLAQGLLAPFQARPSPATHSNERITSSSSSGGVPQAELLRQCCWLLGQWASCLQQQDSLGSTPSKQQAARAARHPATIDTSSSSSSSSRNWWLANVELPCAVLQQQELLLDVPAEALVQQLLAPQLGLAGGTSPHAGGALTPAPGQQQQQQQHLGRQGNAGLPLTLAGRKRQASTMEDGRSGVEDTAAASDQALGSQQGGPSQQQQQQQQQPLATVHWVLPQLLQCCELLSAAAVGYLQTQLPTILSSAQRAQRAGAQQQQPGQWLVQCWAATLDGSSICREQGGSLGRSGSQAAGLASAKKLVRAATSLDQHLKAMCRRR